MRQVRKSRDRCFHAQGGRCYYCRQPMWCADPDIFGRRYGLSEAKARRLQATAEHLIARCEGGSNSAANIVAACRYCNQHRHKAGVALAPAKYQQKVRARLSAGRWHGLRLG